MLLVCSIRAKWMYFLLNLTIDSGMKEDLSLYGKELNYANAIWSAAYVFGQIPSNLILTRVGSSSPILRYLVCTNTESGECSTLCGVP